jgi:hypothetical protein
MSITDINEIFITGKVVKSRAFDPRPGAKITNAFATIKTGEGFVDLSFTLNVVGNQDNRPAFNKVFEQNNSVVVFGGNLNSYPGKQQADKGQETVYQVQGKLNSAYLSQNGSDLSLNRAIVTGTVLQQSDKGLILSAAYAGKKEKDAKTTPIKNRLVKILLPEGLRGQNLKGRRVAISGKITTKMKDAYIEAQTLDVIQ